VPLCRFAFIVKAPGYTAATHAVTLDSAQFSTRVIGVRDLDDAMQAAASLVGNGVQLIELCGGFTGAEAKVIRAHIRSAVPVGLVGYSAAEERALARLFET
jgi:Family of unknown function (DUF6506)